MKLKQKLMDGLAQAAVLFDVDEAGYIGGDEAHAVHRARVDFGAFCEGLASEYLHAAPSPVPAKNLLRRDVQAIEAETDTRRFSIDETLLFERFMELIDERIDRLSQKSPWQRTMILLFFRTPAVIKLFVFVVLLIAGAIMVGKFLGK